MAGLGSGLEARVTNWWVWFAIGLFLLLPVDLLTTILAVAIHGPVVESNPAMGWLLNQGLLNIVLAHLAVVVAAVTLFHGAMATVRRSPNPYRRVLGYCVSLWISLLLVGGVVVVTNNFLVLAWGYSVLSL